MNISDETGAWKNLFTVTLAEQIDTYMLEELKDTKLDLQKLLCISL
jgi:hypothetical protein